MTLAVDSVDELDDVRVVALGQETGDAWRPSTVFASTSRAQARV
jgi:hypothetical protein